YPYLEGYVAFYSHDYEGAAQALRRASADDPFLECLLAQAYEALGDRPRATELYRKAAAAVAHSVASAYAQPFAKRKLAEWNAGGQ
ncbi:MAG TPA: hypothetical protein VML19_00235, partial [Verrucomicrobiae bacterium]|nr:hypothetical protein [Verrucomicrobiae bacterium]